MRHCPFSILQIIANDTGNPTDCCSTATVTISLIDSNDHIPEFPQNTYNLSVMEGSPAGTVISANITVRRWAGSGHSLRPPSRMLGTPGTTNAACVEGTGLSMDTGRRWCQWAHRLWDPVPIRATFLGCSLPVASAPDSSLLWGLRQTEQTLPSLF